MSIRTTVTLDDDVLKRAKEFGKKRDLPFRTALNELVRIGLLNQPQQAKQPFRIKPFHMGNMPGLNEDDIEGLLELAEGPLRR